MRKALRYLIFCVIVSIAPKVKAQEVKQKNLEYPYLKKNIGSIYSSPYSLTKYYHPVNMIDIGNAMILKKNPNQYLLHYKFRDSGLMPPTVDFQLTES